MSQTYFNIEYIIVDGGSTDSTLEIIEKYKKNISYIISEKDNGIYDAWNKGLTIANGEWIAFLGADDVYFPDAVQNYINYLNTVDYSSLHILTSKVMLIDKNNKELRVIGSAWNWKTFKNYMCIAHVGSFHSKFFFEKYGNYNIKYEIVGDYEILLRAKDSLNAAFFDKITVKMKMGGVSNNKTKALTEAFEAKLKNNSRSFFFAKYDFFIAFFIFYFNKLIRR
jgi:glycosyltransferase involved in cell wall biosynthesis